MRRFTSLAGLLLLAALGTAADKDKADPPKEVSSVPHDSKTHGAVQVRSVNPRPVDWFIVLKGDKQVDLGNPPLLDSTVELAPGKYTVEVNKTRREVTIEAGKKTVVWTGELVVEGKGASWYTPYQGKDKKLVSNPPVLNRPTPLFAGTYTVTVEVSTAKGPEEKKLGDAEVKPGKKTVLKYQGQ
jgi:hypothetical protein